MVDSTEGILRDINGPLTDEDRIAAANEIAMLKHEARVSPLYSTRLDARRYQFLVGQDIENDFPRSGLFIGQIPQNSALTGNEANTAIDTAIAKQEAGK